MKYAEYESMITKMLSDPETATVEAQSLLEQLKIDTAAMESAQVAIAEKDEKIRTLQDANIKLLISQTGTVEEAPEDESDDLDFETLVKRKMEDD